MGAGTFKIKALNFSFSIVMASPDSLVGLGLTDAFLQDINDRLPLLTYLDLQQCPYLTDSKLEDIVTENINDLEIVNYYGEIIASSIKHLEQENSENSDLVSIIDMSGRSCQQQ